MPPTHVAHACTDPHPVDYIVALINISVNLMFTFGSFWFLEGASKTWGIDAGFWGDWLFIIGAFIGAIVAARGLFLGVGAQGELSDRMLDRKERDEIFESALFFAASIIFFVGSVLFMPGPHDGKPGLQWEDAEQKENGESWGAYLFIFGSYGFVIAIFFNGYGKSRVDSGIYFESAQTKVFFLKKYGLCMSVLGSAFFVVGSFLYRPGLSKSCNETEVSKIAGEVCASSSGVGTWLYIYGSILFLLDSIGALIVVIIKHISHNDEVELQEKGDLIYDDAGEGTASD